MQIRAFTAFQAATGRRAVVVRAAQSTKTAAPAAVDRLPLNITKSKLVDSEGGNAIRNVDGEIWNVVYTAGNDSVKAINRTTGLEYGTEIGAKDNRVFVLLDTAAPVPGPPSFGQLQSIFKGTDPAAEVLNGRVAMVSFLGVAAVELATGQSFLQQAGSPANAAAALGLVVAVMAASLAPAFAGQARVSELFPSVNDSYPDRQLPKYFTALAEILNGRAAMVGLAGLIINELVRGAPVF